MALQENQAKHFTHTKPKVFSEYVIYEPGDLNLIISVPHGGSCKPRSIPNRVANTELGNKDADVHGSAKDSSIKVCIKNDVFTVHLARLMAEALGRRTGKQPYIVINRLHRIKLDCNRNVEEAAFGEPEAVAAWKTYHDAIETAKAAIGGRGLLLDIHGHSHSENWIELGYGVSCTRMNLGNYGPSDTSIRFLHEWYQKQDESKHITELVSGHKSLGGLLEKAGYKVVPSPKHPSPKSGNYFSGGYSILRHGSKRSGCIDAIQIESPVALRSQAFKRWKYANSLARAVAEFLSINYPTF